LLSILNIKKLVVYILPCKKTIKYFKNKKAEYTIFAIIHLIIK